ncbi:hypothetical protein BDN70DRAFT_887498 [Pholiota conissans]|uniref:Uncharacterized protein n=1 Tax=Pholiota conissans TaxID=109636 RepID=A0A9P6CTV9_9AGAR|nr:hypothetical protein BDN70DRAFT_887498 [Pholiota conissans]
MPTFDESPPKATAKSALMDSNIDDDAIDTGIGLAETVISTVKEVGELLNNIPYVKSLSGVVMQIIKIRDEVKSNRDRCREVIDKVMRTSRSLYTRLADVAKSREKADLSKLEGYLGVFENSVSCIYCAGEAPNEEGHSFADKSSVRRTERA